MKKAYTKIKSQEEGMPPHLEIRHYPKATQEYLMFQIGEYVTRFEEQPEFDSENRVVSHRPTGKLVSVFHLQGWGSTLARAKAMFLKKQKPEDGE